ncbi:hypothetical protein G9A89_012135 [Geosiphon pyriformis]|nr:hypothetical protein G9A89_012135 [Geosiphon pyriformis]
MNRKLKPNGNKTTRVQLLPLLKDCPTKNNTMLVTQLVHKSDPIMLKKKNILKIIRLTKNKRHKSTTLKTKCTGLRAAQEQITSRKNADHTSQKIV